MGSLGSYSRRRRCGTSMACGVRARSMSKPMRTSKSAVIGCAIGPTDASICLLAVASTEAACKIVFTQRLKRSGIVWTISGGQVILNLRVIWLSGVWEDVHQRYLASKSMPVTQGDVSKGARWGQQAAYLLGSGAITP